MSYTAADIAEAETKLKSLAQRVRHGDRDVTYMDVDQQLKVVSYMKRQVQGATSRRSLANWDY